MRMPGLVVTLMTLLVHSAVAAETIQSGVEAMPPVVVKTVPRAGDTKVDPSLAEIRVTFSKDMMTKEMWSWVRASKETFPEIDGEVRYLKDNRTCILPVKLLPGKAYTIWINSADFNSFRDLGQRPRMEGGEDRL